MIDKDAVDALLLLVEEPDRLTERFAVHGRVPRTLVLIVPRETVITLCPRLASSTDEPTTPPRPPVLLHGAHSADTNTIFIGRSLFTISATVVVVASLFARTTVNRRAVKAVGGS